MTDEKTPEPERPAVTPRRLPPLDERTLIQKVFQDSENDYLTVLAIARRARQIQDNEEEYQNLLETEKPTAIALREYLANNFEFRLESEKDNVKK